MWLNILSFVLASMLVKTQFAKRLVLLPGIGVVKWNDVDILWHLMLFSAGAYTLPRFGPKRHRPAQYHGQCGLRFDGHHGQHAFLGAVCHPHFPYDVFGFGLPKQDHPHDGFRAYRPRRGGTFRFPSDESQPSRGHAHRALLCADFQQQIRCAAIQYQYVQPNRCLQVRHHHDDHFLGADSRLGRNRITLAEYYAGIVFCEIGNCRLQFIFRRKFIKRGFTQ